MSSHAPRPQAHPSTAFHWLKCTSALCGTRWAVSHVRKPGSPCGDRTHGWVGPCEGCLVADDETEPTRDVTAGFRSSSPDQDAWVVRFYG
jgi:hypothetical protein